MTYTVNSPLTKTGAHYSGDQLWGAFEPMTQSDQQSRAKRAIVKVAELSAVLHIDELVAGAIVWIETGYGDRGLPFRQPNWIDEGNLGNIGKTGDEQQDAEAQHWITPEDAATALIAHIVAYAYGTSWRSVWDADDLGQPSNWDKRFDLVLTTWGGKPLNSLAQLNNRWAVDRDGAYDTKLAIRANALWAAILDPPVTTPSTPEEPVEQETPRMPLIYRRVPHPPCIDLPVSKPSGGGSGYTLIPTASRKIVGVMNHETQGRGTGPWYRDFFSCPGGARCSDALVDYLITRDGTIYRLNDPKNNRSPWANGGPLGLEGDGPAFYARFGASGVNNSLISIEYEKYDTEDFTDAQVQSGGLLNAYWHDQDDQDWEAYPYVERYGCVTSLAHFEIGTTNCGEGELDDITRVQSVARGQMKKYQTQSDAPATPSTPSVPTQPSTPALPGGADPVRVARAFGTLTKHTPDGKTKIAPWDPEGVISLSYVHRCVEEVGLDYDQWPAAENWWALTDSGRTLDLVTFSNSWQLIRTAERQGIMWASFADAELEAA